VVFVTCSLESKQCGCRCNERLKPIEFFCGCCFQKSRSHCLLIAIRRFARARIQHVENALMMSMAQVAYAVTTSKKDVIKNARLACADFELPAARDLMRHVTSN
jgi:hypothetical protein